MIRSIDRVPDLTSEEYWESHNLAVARLMDVRADSTGKNLLTYEVIRPLSDGQPGVGTAAVTESGLWSNLESMRLVAFHPGDYVLMSIAKDGSEATHILKLGADPDDSLVVRRATRIAAIRASGAPDPAVEGAFDDDPVIALYGLKRLLKAASIGGPPDLPRLLEGLAARASAEAPVRLLARELAARLRGRPSDAPELYEWLRETIQDGSGLSYHGLAQFMGRMAGFSSRRAETVRFLIRLSQPPGARKAARIAAYASLSDPRLFDPARPDDAESEAIFAAYLDILRDPDSEVRAGASGHLRSLSQRIIDPSARSARIRRAHAAMAEAARVETDEGWAHHLRHQLLQLEDV